MTLPPPMRTADQRQIERETAEIQRNADEAWWKNPIYAICAVVAYMFIAALVVPEVKK